MCVEVCASECGCAVASGLIDVVAGACTVHASESFTRGSNESCEEEMDNRRGLSQHFLTLLTQILERKKNQQGFKELSFFSGFCFFCGAFMVTFCHL